jgi:hypothetical protein
VIDRQQIVVNDGPLGCVRPFEAVDPLAVCAGPVTPGVVQATPQQQLAQPMPTPLQVFPRIIPSPGQIPDGFVFGCRRLHRCQQPRAPQLRQLARIAAIRLHPGFRGISAGATTSQLTRVVVTCRCNA